MKKDRRLADERRNSSPEIKHTIWEELEFSWTDTEEKEAIKLWNRGKGIEGMCDRLRPNTPRKEAAYEVIFYLMYLLERGKIKDSGNKLIKILGG